MIRSCTTAAASSARTSANGGGTNVYFRLEVDTLAFNGQVTCANSSCAYPSTGTTSSSEAHKGYAVRLVSDAGSPAPVQGTVPGNQCNSTCGTISAMDDMVVYTPVNGATATQFSIPLFSVDPCLRGSDDQRRPVRHR